MTDNKQNNDVSGAQIEFVDGQPLSYSADEALAVAKADVAPMTEEEDKQVLKRIDWRLLSIMALLNTVQLTDKVSLNIAATYGLIQQANLKGQEYSILAALFYIGYLAAEYPSNYLMQKFPTGKYLTANFILWGIVLTATGAARNFAGLAVGRVLLGVFEAPLNPGLVMITASWWKKSEQAPRATLWYSLAGLVNPLVALLFYGIAHIQVGGMFPYQWMFIILGLITIFLGIALYWILPDSPVSCRFLNERQREVAILRIQGNQTGLKNKDHKKYQVWEAMKDIKVWLLAFGVFLQNMTNGLQGSFTGLIIRGLGFDTYRAVLLTMPVGFIFGLSCLIAAWWMHTKAGQNHRIFTIILCYIPGIVSTAVLFGVPSRLWGWHLFGVYFINIISVNPALMYSLLASNVAGYTKKSAVNSFFFISYSLGNIISPQAFLATEAPRYQTGIAVTLASFSLNIINFAGLYWLYKRENKKRDAAEVDLPPMTEDEKTRMAFSDLTDKENKTLRYST